MKFQCYLALIIFLLSFARGEFAVAGSIEVFSENNTINDCGCDALSKEYLEDNGYTKLNPTDYTNASIIGDDGSTSDPIDLNFDFELFGNKITKLYININGSVSTQRISDYSTLSLRDFQQHTMIAPYWADIDLGRDYESGDIYYKYLYDKQDTKKVVGWRVVWYNVGCFNQMKHLRATFQLTLTNGDGQYLPEGKNVGFCYQELGFSHGNAKETLTNESSYPYERQEQDINNKGYYSCSGCEGDKVFSGFDGGTPATVGVRYSVNEIDNNNEFYYYQVGRYDRPTSEKESIDREKYQQYKETGYIQYDGVNHLIDGSKSCKYSYDFRTTGMVVDVKCNNENGRYMIDLFLPIKRTSTEEECQFELLCNNNLITNGTAGSYVRHSFEVEPSDEYAIKLIVTENGNSTEYSKQITEVPICEFSNCPNKDFSLSINEDDLAASYCSNELLRFSVKSKKGTELTNPKYTWSFSNSETSDLSTPEKTYKEKRKETVSVKITSDECKGGIILDREFDIDVCPCSKDNIDLRINGDDLAASYCSKKVLSFSAKPKSGVELTNPKYIWSFSNSESSDMTTPEKTYTVARKESVSVKITSDECKEGIELSHSFDIDVCPVEQVCPTEFAPTAGKKYILSGWMHVDGANNEISYEDYGSIKVQYEGSEQVDEGIPSGDIIDGWQRIYKEVLIPEKATKLNFELVSKKGNDCYFDDIRFHPVDASMVSYVYDPVTLRLVAELDNENYATFYEYDEEGAMIRVKKETERGIMTIKEARQGGVKTK